MIQQGAACFKISLAFDFLSELCAIILLLVFSDIIQRFFFNYSAVRAIKAQTKEPQNAALIIFSDYPALFTRPERRQREQTFTLQGVPFTTAFTFLTLGLNVLLERL